MRRVGPGEGGENSRYTHPDPWATPGLISWLCPGRLRPGHVASSSNYAAMPYPGHAPIWRDCSWPNPPILLSRFLMLPRSLSSVPQAVSSLFTAVADGPQAASIGVLA